MALNDSGDEVFLLNPSAALADVAAYGDGDYAAVFAGGELHPINGQSIQRVPGPRFPATRDVRYRFLLAPPQPLEMRSLPKANTHALPALDEGRVAVWGSLGAYSNFSPEGTAPPHFLMAAAGAQGLDFVAIADPGIVHESPFLSGVPSVIAVPAWGWSNADGAQAVIYTGQGGISVHVG